MTDQDLAVEQTSPSRPEGTAPTQPQPTPVAPLVEDALVEDVSIDGMCGVY